MKKAKKPVPGNKTTKRKPVRRNPSPKIAPVTRGATHHVRNRPDRIWLVSICVGIVIFSAGLFMRAREAARLTFYASADSLHLAAQPGARPSRLLIPAIDVNTPVYDTTIVRGVWQIHPDGISHLSTSSVPGRSGNIILYGHNKPDRLRRLADVAPGDRLIVATEDGNDRLYIVKKTLIVSPNDLSVVTNTPDETLTVYTCTGFADSMRLVVVAKPFGVPLAGLP